MVLFHTNLSSTFFYSEFFYLHMSKYRVHQRLTHPRESQTRSKSTWALVSCSSLLCEETDLLTSVTTARSYSSQSRCRSPSSLRIHSGLRSTELYLVLPQLQYSLHLHQPKKSFYLISSMFHDSCDYFPNSNFYV